MKVEEAINKIEEILSNVDYNNRPLMKRPTDEEISKNPHLNVSSIDKLSQYIYYGSQMRTERFGADVTVWHFPEGIEEKIEDNKLYKIWYTWRDASDPADGSIYYTVYYIEEVSDAKMKLQKAFQRFLH